VRMSLAESLVIAWVEKSGWIGISSPQITVCCVAASHFPFTR
jgi:hypothetical protein